jgi:hypothetical protein
VVEATPMCGGSPTLLLHYCPAVDKKRGAGRKVSQFLVIVGVQACSCSLLSIDRTIFRHCGDLIKQVQDKTTKFKRDLKEALALRSNLISMS